MRLSAVRASSEALGRRVVKLHQGCTRLLRAKEVQELGLMQLYCISTGDLARHRSGKKIKWVYTESGMIA